MTPSTTNTAAREVVPAEMMERLADAAAALDKFGRRDQCRDLMHLHEHLSTLTQQQGGEQEAGALVGKWRRLASYEDEEGELEVGSESAVRLIRCADELEAALRTKQQGGEQEAAWQNIETAEVEFLNNLAEKGGLADPVPGMLRHCARLIAGKRPAVVAPDRYETEEEGDAYAHGYVDGEDAAALRSKQPAASEGDDGDGVANCAECGAFLESVRPGKHQHPTCSQANTSKQAAGEAVAWTTVEQLERVSLGEIGFIARQDMVKPAPNVPLYTTPPRHPADEEAVCAEDLRWLDDIAADLKQAGGSTNNMRLIALNRAIAALQAGTPT